MANRSGFEVPSIDKNDVEALRRLAEELTEKLNSLLNMVRNLEQRIKVLES